MIKGKLAYLNRLYSRIPLKPVQLSQHIEGASPPSVFIGRIGYPKVDIGPLIPPQRHGDTSSYDTPEEWITKEQAEIINFRMGLVRGKVTVGIKEDNAMVEKMRDISLAKSSTEVEAHFTKIPQGRMLHEEIPAFGPSAPLKEIVVDNKKYDPRIERAYFDTDLKAADAVIELYNKGIYVSKIQKAFSIGAFGLEKNRRLVPTRWSITAVDDTLGKYLLARVKWYEPISEYRVYEFEYLNNKFVVLLLPGKWQYESMECFFPQIIGDRIEIYSDWESYEPRKTYASIGGCYYSTRFAICEQLEHEKAQGGAIVLREAYQGYIPLGVWNVREGMRAAMRSSPKKFTNLGFALGYINTRLKIKVPLWLEKSTLFRKIVNESSPGRY